MENSSPKTRRIKRRIGTVPRLVLALFIVTSGVLGLVVLQVSQTFGQRSVALVRQNLVDEVAEYERAIGTSTSSNVFIYSKTYLIEHQLNSQKSIVIAIVGHPILGSTGSQGVLPDGPIKNLVYHFPTTTKVLTFSALGVPYLVVATPILISGRPFGVFIATADLSQEITQMHQMLVLVLFEAAIALLFTMGSGYLLLRRVMKTVGGITNAAIGIADGDLSRRIDYSGATDEVGTLAKTFDEMLNRLDEMMEGQKRLLSDVSHQLKTPLTIINGNLELIARSGQVLSQDNIESFEAAKEEITFMSHLIDQLLLLGRTMERDFILRGPVDFRSFMADLYSSSVVIADRNWQYQEPPDLVVEFDAAKVRGALLNLVENAVKVTQMNDVIEISATTRGSVLEISVSDSGPGVPTGMEDAIFARFARGSQPYKKGAGLGLSIVDAVAKAHKGCVVLEVSPYGGARFSMLLPLVMAEIPDDDYEL